MVICLRMDKKKVVNRSDEPTETICNCKTHLNPYQIFDENVEDIARCLGQIMLICGINTSKSQKAKQIIKRVFVYHEKLRTACKPSNENRLCREDLLQALRIKCDMEGMEALLTYAIIKRAFKAFYHGKCPFTISNPIMDAMAIHSQRSAWMHAAYRTARIFDNYRAAFFWAHKSYEKQIRTVYQDLFNRLQTRADPITMPMCRCRGCRRGEIVGALKAGEQLKEKSFKLKESCELPHECAICGLQMPKFTQDKSKRPRPITNHELKLERCEKCNSPRLICECFINPHTGQQYGECGQDSYKVRWYRVEDDQDGAEDEEDECRSDWENHHCPIDCQGSGDSDVCGHGGDDDNDSEKDEFHSCDEEIEEEDDAVAKLENYLNKLWAEEVAAKKNPKTFVPSLRPIPNPCQKCE